MTMRYEGRLTVGSGSGCVVRNARRACFAFGLPLVLGVLFGACTSVRLRDGELIVSPTLAALCVAYALLFTACFEGAWRAIGWWSSRGVGEVAHVAPRFPMQLRWHRWDVLIGAVVMLALWIPFLVALYPGILWFDTSNQLVQLLAKGAVINDRHPVFDTCVFGLAYKLGEGVFGDSLKGLYLLIVGQMMLGALALSIQCCWLERIGVSRGLRLAALAVCALSPAFPLFFSSLAKDTLTAPFWVLFCVAFEEALRTSGAALHKRGWAVLLVVTACVQSLTKKASALVILVSMLILVFAYRRKRVVFTAVVCAAVSICSIPVFNAAFVGVTGREIVSKWRLEALAVPLQQVANAIRDDPALVDQSNYKMLERVCDVEPEALADSYNWMAADGVKHFGKRADRSAFVSFWAATLPGHVGSYLEAWLGLVTDWFSFSERPSIVYSQYAFSNEHTAGRWQKMVGGRVQTLAGSEILHYVMGIARVPAILLILQKCLWASVLPCACLYLLARARCGMRGLASMAPFLLSILVLVIGPTSLWAEGIRYVAPMMCTAPLMVGCAIRQATDEYFPSEALSLGSRSGNGL